MSYTLSYSYPGVGQASVIGINPPDFSNNIIIPNLDPSGNSVVSIYDNAFLDASFNGVDMSGCTSLTSIGVNAFKTCTSLASVTFPASLNTIAQAAFESCTSLTIVDLSPCTSLTTTGIYAFFGCGLISLTFPASFTTISEGTFASCASLTSVTFPTVLNTIGNYAFDNCTSLTSAYFTGTTIPTLGTSCFNNNGSPSTAYYVFGTTNPDDLTLSGYFDFYVETGFPSLPCFNEGTKILTDKGYKPVESLRKGDLISTLKHGFLPIHSIGKGVIEHKADKERIKNQLYKCQSKEYPTLTEDLILTGCHSILVDWLTQEQGEKTMEEFGFIFETDGKPRLMSYLDNRASVYEIPGTYTIYHLALEHENEIMNYGIFANGLLVESCSIRVLRELSHMTLIE